VISLIPSFNQSAYLAFQPLLIAAPPAHEG
jgi:hypothetical protein